MKKLPIFPYQIAPIEGELPKRTNHNCQRCTLHTRYAIRKDPKGNILEVRNNVLPKLVKGIDQSKYLLVILDQPCEQEMQQLQAGHGERYRQLLVNIRNYWKGNIVFDFAKRCHASEGFKQQTNAYNRAQWVEKCRPYVTNAFKLFTYDRILCMGKEAWQAVTGRTPDPLSIRRGFTRLLHKGETPAYIVMDWEHVTDNRFYRRWFYDDLAWALQTSPPVEKQDGMCFIIETEADALHAEAKMRECGSFGIDCEWTGAPYNNDHTLLSVAVTGKYDKDSYVWPAKTLTDRHAPIVQPLKRIIEDEKVGMYGQYIKVDFHGVWWGLGAEPRGLVLDTQVAVKMLESESNSALDVSNERVGGGGHKDELKAAITASRAKLIDGAQKRLAKLQSEAEIADDRYWGKKRKDAVADTVPFDFAKDTLIEKLDARKLSHILDKKSTFQDQYAYGYVPPQIRDVYNAKDTTVTMRLGEMLEDRMNRDSSLPRVWKTLMKPGIETLFKMERNGFPVNLRVMEENIAYFRDLADSCRRRIAKHGAFDPDSNTEIGKFLFETLKLPDQGLTEDGSYAVDDESLKALGKKNPTIPDHIDWLHPVVPDLLEHRKVSKLLGTYSEGFARFVRDDGRVHPQTRPDGARSGRMSMTDPALQTVPAAEDDPRALMIRRAFVSIQGWSLLKFDYDQLEYKVAAWRSGDKLMIEGFIRKEDIHTITTKAICKYMWGIEPEDWDKQDKAVKKSQRKVGKTLNFALMFGMGDERLAQTLGITEQQAEELRAALMGNYKGYAAFQEWCEAESMRTGYARTAWWDEAGNVIPFRKRQNQIIGSRRMKYRSQGLRIATNTAIQGLASDLCLNALIRLQKWIEDEGLPIEIICTIHDALFFHMPNEIVGYAAPIIKAIMEDYYCDGVPITVSGEIGQNWADMIEYTDEIGEYLTPVTCIFDYMKTPMYEEYLKKKKAA